MTRAEGSVRLESILRALPPKELDGIVQRLGVRIDSAKRLDSAAQVARALVALPELRDPARLHPAAVDLLHRVAEARGALLVPSVPPALEPLAARGLMFARSAGGLVELLLPAAYVVQLRSWEGEDPCGVRALLSQASFETTSAIAAHYLTRPATPPIALSLVVAWEVLSNPTLLAEEIGRLAPSERRVLEAVEREGGEVDTEELLELEREPMRLRTATGVSPSRRGVGSALERRGFLVPVHPNRHIVPTEVSVIIGAQHRAESAARRLRVKSFVLSGDHAPRRARFAHDPCPIGVGLALTARESGMEVRAGVGTPKSLVQRMATRFGRDPVHVGFLIALSRAMGLWESSALGAASPPGSLPIGEVAQTLFSAWRRGGAWDEAREDPEMLRLPQDQRDPSPVGVVREMVIEALLDLGDVWIPWISIFGYFRTDHRMAGLRRLFRRWSDRTGAPAVDPLDVARRVVHESLPALGVLDLGEAEELADAAPDSSSEELPETAERQLEIDRAVTLRLTPRGRSLVGSRKASIDQTGSKFLDAHVLRIGPGARIHAVLGLAGFVEVTRAQETLDLLVAPQTLARALSAGIEADILRSRIEAVAPLPESLSRTLAQASVVLGRGTYQPCSAFMWVDDSNLREMLRTRRATSDLFVDPSPPGGLVVAAGVDLERLTRRCRAIGIEIVFEGQVVRARTIPPPSGGRTSSSQRMPRVSPPKGTEKA